MVQGFGIWCFLGVKEEFKVLGRKRGLVLPKKVIGGLKRWLKPLAPGT